MANSVDRFRIFSGNAHPALAKSICDRLEMSLGDAYVGRFPDGEIDVKVNEDVRGADVFIVQPTCPPVNENILELLILIDCFRRASAGRITAVMPYFGYARKDRKDEGRVPITAKLVADLISEAGADRVLTIDLHASQIQGFFNIPVDHLYAKPAMIGHYKKMGLKNLTIVSPDVGGIKLARAYAKSLGAGLAIVDKRRVSSDKIETEHLIGEVKGKNVLIMDDMISTGGSITEAARIVKEHGAERVFLSATHPVLCGPARERLDAADVEKVFVTDTIPIRGVPPKKVEVITVADLLARAILSIHRAESVSRLFDE